MNKIGEKIIKLQDAKFKLHANNSNEASIFIAGELAEKLGLIENEIVKFKIEKENLIQLLCFTFSFGKTIFRKEPTKLDLNWFEKYFNLINRHFLTTSDFIFKVQKQSQDRYYFISLEQPSGLNIRDIFIQDHIRLLFYEGTPRIIKIEFSNLELHDEFPNIAHDAGVEYIVEEKIKSPLNRILFGPPGTGKTFNSISHAVSIVNGTEVSEFEDRSIIKSEYDRMVEEGLIQFVTFHQSYSYEEFVEGIKPFTKDGQVFYEIADGIFKKTCLLAEANSDKRYVLIIDEINRGNISKIFGELITLLEESKRLGASEELKIKLAYSGVNSLELFGVPKNLYIIGTMNSADRSIALIDTALRRRFTFIEFKPLSEKLIPTIDGIDLNKLINAINSKIEYLLDKDHLIGHAYFMQIFTKDDLLVMFRNKILPLLEEYFYGDYSKIQLVLGDKGSTKPDEFKIVRLKPMSSGMKHFRQFVEGFDDKEVFEIDSRISNKKFEEITPDYFKSIYE